MEYERWEFFFRFLAGPPCTAGLDIGIVIDKSKSIKIPNLEKVITFLGDLVKKFNPAPKADHFGLITFNEQAELAFSFADSKYHNKKDLLRRIANEPLKLNLQTRTDLALKLAKDKLFTKAGGDRPDKPNVMIVLTDGRPTHPDKSFNFKEFAKKLAKKFKVSYYSLEVSIIINFSRIEEIYYGSTCRLKAGRWSVNFSCSPFMS